YLTKLKTAFSLSHETGMLRHIAFCISVTHCYAKWLALPIFLTLPIDFLTELADVWHPLKA
ncbi:MAG: hypothetical protein K2K23_01125, partial [Muribaculaceae bacterium]|nr:hypothetical protein [Muribaculaceae bacterium]